MAKTKNYLHFVAKMFISPDVGKIATWFPCHKRIAIFTFCDSEWLTGATKVLLMSFSEIPDPTNHCKKGKQDCLLDRQ